MAMRISTVRVARGARWTAAAALIAAAAACGGRATQEVAVDRPLDDRLSCVHIDAERRANVDRIADLEEEREANRLRSLTRAPGAVLGNPLTAIALADPSVAIYREIEGLELRNGRLDELAVERGCTAET